MGKAVATGLVEAGSVSPGVITIASPHPSKLSDMESLGVNLSADNRDAAIGADLLILAVKPWVVETVIREISDAIDLNRTEVAVIAAGISGDDLRAFFGSRCPDDLSIVMPNTAMRVRKSMTFIVTVEGSCKKATTVFGELGRVMEIGESQLPAATAVASCGIAFAMRYVRAVCQAGVELGLRPGGVQQMTAQTLEGVAALLQQPDAHPETEIDKVTTPGGLTVKGLNAMEKAGFTAAVIEGIKKSVK